MAHSRLLHLKEICAILVHRSWKKQSIQILLNVESEPDNLQAGTETNRQATSRVKAAHFSAAVLKMESLFKSHFALKCCSFMTVK